MSRPMYLLTNNPNIQACRDILNRQSQIGQRALYVMRRRCRQLSFRRSMRLMDGFEKAIDRSYEGSIPKMVEAFDEALVRKPGWWRY